MAATAQPTRVRPEPSGERPWPNFADAAPARRPPPQARIAFLFNAQAHQVLHGATIAEELARGWPVTVDILASTQINLDIARRAILPDSERLLGFELVGSALARWIAARRGVIVPPKLLTLLAACRLLNRYDALALPERTSILLRKLGVRRPRFIHIDHGAGDRAAGFDKRIAQFDFALMAGEKQRRRMIAEQLVAEESSVIVGYPKFEAADRLRDRGWSPFADQKPVVLYNPHFSAELGSWTTDGHDIARNILESGRYNLIIAPHIRMCDSRRGRAAAEAIFGLFRVYPNVHLDFGSQRSIDMTYTSLADIYLGDVSSQVYEFLRRPRPCLFVNSHGRAWRDDPNYAHWAFGDVVGNAAAVLSALDEAAGRHGEYLDAQLGAFSDTFDLSAAQSSSVRAAAAIADFMMIPA